MTRDRDRDLARICESALERPAEQRSAFLAEACGGDDELRREAESLLARDSEAGSFLETPALAVAAAGIVEAGPALTVGGRLGPYLIVAPLGTGGMGEVYRATDTNLKRAVAIKVLPDAVAGDAERLARFQREAEVLAALNHPNIAAIYGLERTGPVIALVMELVEGPTLADRIGQGAISIDEALPIARQVAEALEAAHEQGIIHRDLKPANIKLRPDGTVKVLDFGLAKAMDMPLGARSIFSMSPTITTPAMTLAGIIMGTAAYMSPEQAKGKAADRRADIWAFGVVFYEMVTGRQLFTGETAAEVLARVMKDKPRLGPVPASVRPIVERCLRRDVRKRWQAIGDVRIALEEGVVVPVATEPASLPSRLWGMATLAWIIASVAVAGAAVLALVHFRETPAAQHSARFLVAGPETLAITTFTVSPDGRYLAFVAAQPRRRLWVRPVDSIDARALPGTEGASIGADQIFWSPDSAFIGFVLARRLMKVSVNGGPPQSLTDAAGLRSRATWGRKGVILFDAGPRSPILRVPESGGVAVAVTKLEDTEGHSAPQFLPDGRHFLYYVSLTKPERTGIYVGSLEDGVPSVRLLPDASPARYTPPAVRGGGGHLLFLRDATLMAQPFDPQTLRLTGEVFPVAEPVTQFSVSESGALAYMSGATGIRQELVWLDRSGRQVEVAGPPGEYANFRLSPDEKSVVFNQTESGNTDIWALDMTRGVPSRISFDPGVDNLPIWSHDGLRILWPSNRSGRFHLYMRPATGTGPDEPFINMGTGYGWATHWSSDGKFVLYQRPGERPDQRTTERPDADLWIAPQSAGRSNGEQKPVPYLQSPFGEGNAVFSPDGHWVAYVSDESGRPEVYVQAFPLTNEKDRISTGGGTDPAWRKDGAELFYLAADRSLMAVPVQASAAAFEPGVAKTLFPIPGNRAERAYAPSGDGSRFLITRPIDGATAVPITVVLNWQAGIKK